MQMYHTTARYAPRIAGCMYTYRGALVHRCGRSNTAGVNWWWVDLGVCFPGWQNSNWM